VLVSLVLTYDIQRQSSRLHTSPTNNDINPNGNNTLITYPQL